jgi:hypothetical protein
VGSRKGGGRVCQEPVGLSRGSLDHDDRPRLHNDECSQFLTPDRMSASFCSAQGTDAAVAGLPLHTRPNTGLTITLHGGPLAENVCPIMPAGQQV